MRKDYSPTRSNNLISQPDTFLNRGGKIMTSNQNNLKPTYSRSEQDFFKQAPGSKTFHTGFGQK